VADPQALYNLCLTLKLCYKNNIVSITLTFLAAAFIHIHINACCMTHSANLNRSGRSQFFKVRPRL
jgi:hypothetical protein